jgi:hypothetical protein
MFRTVTFSTVLRLTILGTTLAAAVACDDDGSEASSLDAPSDLAAAIKDGGVHLTWKDNSTKEVHFMIFRRMKEDANFPNEPIMQMPANSTSHHDADVESGMTYVYMVHGMDSAGNSSPHSGDVEIKVP